MSLFIDLLNCDPSSVVGGTFIAVVGCLLSYKLGRHNKRIEDFNSIRDQIEPMFKREVESPVPLFRDIDDSQLDILTSLMYPWQRKGFAESIRAYQEAQDGEFESEKNSRTLKYKNPEPVSKAAAKVLTYLKRR